MKRQRRSGFTLLELQVAIILLAFGVVTLGSLMATQSRLMKRLESGYTPGATVYLTRSADPWVRKLHASARVTFDEPATESAPSVTAVNDVVIISRQHDLVAETITVTADVTPIE